MLKITAAQARHHAREFGATRDWERAHHSLGADSPSFRRLLLPNAPVELQGDQIRERAERAPSIAALSAPTHVIQQASRSGRAQFLGRARALSGIT